MRSLKVIIKEIRDDEGLKRIVEVYEEIAAATMQKIRTDTLAARDYYQGLIKISQEIGADFAKISEGKTKSAAVYVSANAGLYGDIVKKTFYLFLDYIKKSSVDIYVVGRVGKDLMARTAPAIKYKSFEMPDDVIDAAKFDLIAKNLTGYKDIIIFYGKFDSLVNQSAAASKISGDLLGTYQAAMAAKKDVKRVLNYLYEPDVYTVSKFFGEEILMASVEQMFRESQLAKQASRLMHLDSAINQIDEKIGIQKSQRLKIKKMINDKKQRGIVTGILTREKFLGTSYF